VRRTRVATIGDRRSPAATVALLAEHTMSPSTAASAAESAGYRTPVDPLPDPLPDRASLLVHGNQALRAVALDVLSAGLRAADPGRALREIATRDGDVLRLGSTSYHLSDYDQVIVVGAGKASLPIAEVLSELLGEKLGGGIVVVRHGAAHAVPGLHIVEASHPVPDETSEHAGRLLLDLMASTGPNDLIIGCFTGGSSALVSVPPSGMSFSDKQQLHRLLLASGATINDINAVRKHVSAIKGGRLLAASPATAIVNLTVSDVVGNQADLITDPTAVDSTDPDIAIKVLHDFDLWNTMPQSVREHLTQAAAHSPKLLDKHVTTHVLVDGARSCDAMSQKAQSLGWNPVNFGVRVEGEASTVGGLLATLAAEAHASGNPFQTPCVIFSAGGEMTVTLNQALLGAGGPNQEAALAFAHRLPEATPAAAVFMDSDGSDGGTIHAGGIADNSTAARARQLGLDLKTSLLGHSSTNALAALDDTLTTGPTGTNISDMWVVAVPGMGS